MPIALTIGATDPLPAEASSGAQCNKWGSLTQPPPTIRVLRRKSNRIEVVNFRKYVITVMGKEWPSYLPMPVVAAGAVAVKQYAWYHAVYSKRASNGRCFDVRDGTVDQLYKPNKSRVRPDHHEALEMTWGTTLRKHGRFVMTGYRRGGKSRCGRDATGWKLFAKSAVRCAENGWSWQRILRHYYGPGVELVGGGGGGGAADSTVPASTTPAAATPDTTVRVPDTAEHRVVDDRSQHIHWRGSWRRVRNAAAYGDTVTYSGLSGSTASFRFEGTSLQVIGTTGAARGWLEVWINGKRRARVNLLSETEQTGVTLFQRSWRRDPARTVVLRVVGTAQRPRADLDAIVIS